MPLHSQSIEIAISVCPVSLSAALCNVAKQLEIGLYSVYKNRIGMLGRRCDWYHVPFSTHGPSMISNGGHIWGRVHFESEIQIIAKWWQIEAKLRIDRCCGSHGQDFGWHNSPLNFFPSGSGVVHMVVINVSK